MALGLLCLALVARGYRKHLDRALPQMPRAALKLRMSDWNVEPPPRWWETKRMLRARMRQALKPRDRHYLMTSGGYRGDRR